MQRRPGLTCRVPSATADQGLIGASDEDERGPKARGGIVERIRQGLRILRWQAAALGSITFLQLFYVQGFTAEVRIASTVRTRAELRVSRDGYAVDRRNVELTPGENDFKVPGLHVREKGFHVVEVVVRPEQDTPLQNNTIRSLVVVPGEARILYVDGDEDQIPYLKSALELEGMLVEGRPATGVPQNLSELLSFDAFILSNVPADRLSRRQMQMVRTYVRDFGGGFLMLGGDESFGLGGYFHTPIEEILPVRMPIQKDLIRPSLGIILVIDKSGSMQGVKIQLAKRPAIATAEAINPRDQIGVIGFDGESRVILELTSAADRATITNHISALDAGGGTFLYPALEDAHGRRWWGCVRPAAVGPLLAGQNGKPAALYYYDLRPTWERRASGPAAAFWDRLSWRSLDAVAGASFVEGNGYRNRHY